MRINLADKMVDYEYMGYEGVGMTESDENHVSEMIRDGYSNGELATELENDMFTLEEVRGWWKVMQ